MIQQMIYKGTASGYKTVAVSKGLGNQSLMRRVEMLCRAPGTSWMRGGSACPIYSRCALGDGAALGLTVKDLRDNRNRSLSNFLYVPREDCPAQAKFRYIAPETFLRDYQETEQGSSLPELDPAEVYVHLTPDALQAAARALFADAEPLAALIAAVPLCAMPGEKRGFSGVCVRLGALEEAQSRAAYLLMEGLLRIHAGAGAMSVGYRTVWTAPENNVQYPIFFTSPGHMPSVEPLNRLRYVLIDLTGGGVQLPKRVELQPGDEDRAMAQALLSGDVSSVVAAANAINAAHKRRAEEERKERERQEAARRAEEARKERERQEALRRAEEARKERERQEAARRAEEERKERERQEALRRAEEERKERERQEALRRAEEARKEQERQEAARRAEEERKERERQEAARRAEEERKERERQEAARRAEEERREQERIERQQQELLRIEEERRERKRQRIAAEEARKEQERQESLRRAEEARKEQERQEALRKADEERREREWQEKVRKAREAQEERDRQEAARRAEEERREQARQEAVRRERERQEAERKADEERRAAARRQQQELIRRAEEARKEQERLEALRKAEEEQRERERQDRARKAREAQEERDRQEAASRAAESGRRGSDRARTMSDQLSRDAERQREAARSLGSAGRAGTAPGFAPPRVAQFRSKGAQRNLAVVNEFWSSVLPARVLREQSAALDGRVRSYLVEKARALGSSEQSRLDCGAELLKAIAGVLRDEEMSDEEFYVLVRCAFAAADGLQSILFRFADDWQARECVSALSSVCNAAARSGSPAMNMVNTAGWLKWDVKISILCGECHGQHLTDGVNALFSLLEDYGEPSLQKFQQELEQLAIQVAMEARGARREELLRIASLSYFYAGVRLRADRRYVPPAARDIPPRLQDALKRIGGTRIFNEELKQLVENIRAH